MESRLTRLKQADALPVSLDEVKAVLRLQDDRDDAMLKSIIQRAAALVEEKISKTLIQSTWSFTHRNNRLLLPRGPVLDILEVRVRGKKIEERAYEIGEFGNTKVVTTPFSWRDPAVTVIYTAGFGESTDATPLTLQQAVITASIELYEKPVQSAEARSSFSRLLSPWIDAHQSCVLG